MNLRHPLLAGAFAGTLLFLAASTGAEEASHPAATAREGLVALWSKRQPAFGLYVTQPSLAGDPAPSAPVTFSVETGRELARNAQLDFAFLSLEHHYDAASARNVADATVQNFGSSVDLLVRIPPISTDGVDAARARVREVLALGADGVVIPHVLSLEEARTAVSFFDGVDVWSPSNPEGSVVAMLIVEDPDVFDELEAIADIPGYSALVCGIGSLTSALGGDREAAEATCLDVLDASTRAGMVDLMTVDASSVALRVEQGFLALLAYGPQAQEAIRIGRTAAGRP